MPVRTMSVKEHVFLKMKEELEQKTQAEVDRILAEVEEVENQTMASIKEEVKRDAGLKLKQELEEMQTTASAQMAEDRIQTRKKLLEKRDAYVKDIFDEAKAQLCRFTSSSDYKDFLLTKVANAAVYDFETPVIQVRPDDLRYSSDIIKAYGRDVKVEPNEDIDIGGFIVIDQTTSVVLDVTLDFALNNQDEWFRSHSGLVIGKGGN